MKQYLILAFFVAPGLFAQNIDIPTQTRNPDFSNFPVTLPATVVGALPTTCVPGQVAFLTTALFGQNLYGCVALNTWALEGGGAATPQVSLSQTALSFGSQMVAQAGAQQKITITNMGSAYLAVSGIRLTGPNASDFNMSQNCGTVVPSGANCSINLTFTPSIVGTETATLSIADNQPGSPQTIVVTGLGVAAITSGGLVVNASATVAHNNDLLTLTANRPVNWVLTSGSSGMLITVDGTHAIYTAPASIQNQHTLLGCPVAPNDSIFNTRIDGLPVHPNSANWTSSANIGTNGLSFDYAWGTSVADKSTPLTNEVFYYTGASNGPWLIPPTPGLRRENGSYVSDQNGSDHHIVAINKDTCQFWETYNNYVQPHIANGTSYTATSGYSYNGLSYKLPTNGSADAAGLPLGPLTLHLDELKNGAIHHAVLFTLAGGFIFGDSKSVFWPATQPHYVNGSPNSPPYGARFRLKASFDISKFSPMAQTVLTALKQYGMILADAGTGPTITVDTDITRDSAAMGVLGQISSNKILMSNFEAVDESTLMVSANSSQVNPNNPYVQPASYVAISAVDQANTTNQVLYPIALQGVSIALQEPILYAVAGSYTYNLPFWVTGSTNQSVNWSLVSGPGSVSPAGVYIPPATVTAASPVVLKAVSAADSSAIATQYLTILPTGNNPAPGTLRVDSGGGQQTDKNNNVWLPDQGYEAGDYVHLNGDYPNWPAQSNPEINIYQAMGYTYGSDIEYRFLMPNGNYQVRFMFGQAYNSASVSTCTMGPAQKTPQMVEAQGQVAAHYFIYGNAINSTCATPTDLIAPAQVTNNVLIAAVRPITNDNWRGTAAGVLNGIEIIPDSSTPRLTIDEDGQVTTLGVGKTLGFYAVGWYMPNTVTWSVTGGGAISATGLYMAPAIAPAGPVTITAISTTNPTVTASATVTVQ
jgi:hypothetical protein